MKWKFQLTGTAYIEEPETHLLVTPTVSGSHHILQLSCTASGHDRVISWTKDGHPLPQDYFTVKEDHLESDGGFRYDQDNALRQTLTWIPPEMDCKMVNKHDGAYRCEASVVIAGEKNTESVYYHVKVQCKLSLCHKLTESSSIKLK